MRVVFENATGEEVGGQHLGGLWKDTTINATIWFLEMSTCAGISTVSESSPSGSQRFSLIVSSILRRSVLHVCRSVVAPSFS